MMNQRTILTGRWRCFSTIGLPAIWASVTTFMSCTLCNCGSPIVFRQCALQMRGNRGLMETDPAKNKLTNLSFEVGGLAIGETWHGRQPCQRRRQHRVMREPEQVQRFARDARGLARCYRVIQRGREHGPNQSAHLRIDNSRE